MSDDQPKPISRLQLFADYLTLLDTTAQLQNIVARMGPRDAVEIFNPLTGQREEIDKHEGTLIYNGVLEQLLVRFDSLVLGAEVKAIERMPAPLKPVDRPVIETIKKGGIIMPSGGKPR